MDVVLEVFDHFVFDRLYASLLPSTGYAGVASQKFAGNATYPVLDQLATGNYHYEPATQYISFQPSDFAYMSQWNRDNIYRQATSLFLITWYVLLHLY